MNDVRQLNIIGAISHFFTSNRPLTILLLAGSLVFGLSSFILTPKQYNPEITRPAFSVQLTYSGATTQQAIDRVVYELVEKIYAVPGVDDVLSEVADGARIQTTVIFDVGYDATRAKVDLLSQLEQHSYLARGYVAPPSIIEINPETIPVLQVVFSSPSMEVSAVREAVVRLSHDIINIPEVSDVQVLGGYAESLVVEVEPTALHTYGVTLDALAATLRGGSIRTVAPGTTDGHYTVPFVLDAHTYTPEEVGALAVLPGVLVRDIARVYRGTAGERSYVLHHTKVHEPREVVVLAVSKVEGSSAPVVTSAVMDRIAEYTAQSDLTFAVVGDDGVTAQREIAGLTANLITSIAIVGGVLLLFLSARAASVVLVAIPVTLLVVFGLGYLFGQTINRITLFALILSLGLLVDSAIVVVENIYTHLRRASRGVERAARELIIAGAVHEVGIGLLLSTLTSVIVFLPMLYITGMMGPYMGPIAFFVPAALIVSLLVAVVITPFIASRLLSRDEKRSWISVRVSVFMDALVARYTDMLARILASRTLQRRVLGGALALFLLSLMLPLFGLVHFQMLPRADRDQLYVYLDTPVGTSVERTAEVAQALGGLFLEHEEVRSLQYYLGEPPVLDFNGMFKGAQGRDGSEQASIRVNLTPTDERRESSTELTADLRALVAAAYPEYVAHVRFNEEPPGPPVRATLVAKVTGDALRDDLARSLYEHVVTVEGVVDRYVSIDAPIGRAVYTLDHDAAALYGVTPVQVNSVLSLLSGPFEATEYVAAPRAEYTPVLIALPHEAISTPAHYEHLAVTGTDGAAVPLGSLLSVSYEVRASRAYLERATPVTYVTAEVADRSIVYVVIELMRDIRAGDLSDYEVVDWGLFGMELVHVSGERLTIVWGGEWEMTLENFRDLGIAMGVALLLVYGVLVAQYRSFDRPAYILVTVPLGLIGILTGFFVLDRLFGIFLTATALIGFIALIGLVVNNAIIYLEYVQQARNEGLVFTDALLAAGAARLRPILLTSLTTILGSLTIASDPVWSGLAFAIVFGLSLSTVLTLVIYPTLLVYFGAGKSERA